MCQELGTMPDICMSGEEALDLIKRRYKSGIPLYKLILLDYSMPGKNGPETSISICGFCTEHEIEKPYICCVTAYVENHFK